MIGVQYDAVTNDYAVWVNGDLQGYRDTLEAACELENEAIARYVRQAASVPCKFIDAVEQHKEVWELTAA